MLACALWGDEPDEGRRSRALKLAQRTVDDETKAGEHFTDEAQCVRTWLEAHR